MQRARIPCVVVLCCAMGAAFAPAASAAVTSGPDFSCRASAVRVSTSLLGTPLLFSEPIVANDKKVPCDDESRQAASLNVLGLVSSAAVNATTDGEPGSGNASAFVNKTSINSAGGAITADVLTSQASASCSASGVPAFSGGSQILRLKVGTTTIPVSGAPNQTINAGVAQIVINEQVVSPDGKQVTVRALRVTTSTALAPLTRVDVVIAESIADASACKPPRHPECSDSIDNGDPEDPLPDALDPGCHTDGDANNPRSYDPNDDSETNANECSDGIDNDKDGNRDFGGFHPDPKCASPDDALETV